MEALRRVSLEYIHSSGYIHGDVIAENVLVSGNKVVLGNFGWDDLLAYERIMIRLITGQWYNYDVWFTLRDGPNVKKIPMDDVIERYLKNLVEWRLVPTRLILPHMVRLMTNVLS